VSKFAFKRWLVQIRRTSRDIIFRAICVLTLAVVAVGLGWNNANKEQKYHSKEWTEEHGNQAERGLVFYTLWLDVFTGALAVSTLGLWVVTFIGIGKQGRETRRSMRIAKDAANAAVESNKISRELFVAEQRPWVNVQVEARGDLLVYSTGAHVDITIKMSNIGRSPALKVYIDAIIYCGNNIVSLEDAFYGFCAAHIIPRSKIALQFGRSVFPNQEIERKTQARCTAKHIRMANTGGIIVPFIFVCAHYFYEGSDTSHRTAYVIDITGGGRAALPVSAPEEVEELAIAISKHPVNFARMPLHEIVD